MEQLEYVHDILGALGQEKQSPREVCLVVEFFAWFYYGGVNCWQVCEVLQVDDSVELAPQGAMDYTGESGCLMKWVEVDGGPLDRWWWKLFCYPLPQLPQWTGGWWWQVKGETSILSCVVTPADGIIASHVVCNLVSMNYIFEQYNEYPLFFNCHLKHDIFSMNSHVNGFFWWQIAC